MPVKIKWTLVVFVAVIALSASFLLGAGLGPDLRLATVATPEATVSQSVAIASLQQQVPDDLKTAFKTYWDTWQLLQDEYYSRPIDKQKMIYGSIRGMVSSLGDPFTSFSTPEDTAMLKSDMEGRFDGIGATVEMRDEMITVVAPLEGTPSEKAGLRPGDVIAKIDGKETTGMSLIQAVTLIRGPRGSKVSLSIFRRTAHEPIEVTITRAEIQVPSVTGKMLQNDIALVKINQFGDNTVDELDITLRRLLAQSPRAMILDLRSNPGGYLDGAQEVLGRFLKAGSTALYEQDADGKRIPLPVRGKQAVTVPMTVLTNQGSASAAEIVAGALQDTKRATAIGEKTFGKGSVQNVHDLGDGSSVRITIAHWLTPNGREIHGKGLEPDIAVPMTDDDYDADRDPQLDRAVEYLQNLQKEAA